MLGQLSEIWGAVLSLLEDEVSPVGFNTWIKSLDPFSIEGNTLNIYVQNQVNKSMVDLRYGELIKNAVREVSGRFYDINVHVKDAPPLREEGRAQGRMAGLIQKYTFDNFVVGGANRFAHAAALAVAEAPALAYNPLFLYGGVGLGKTHLMHAIGNYILSQNQKSKVLYITAEAFTNELINSIKDNKNKEFRNKYRFIDVLMVDDIQFIAGKATTEEEFFHTFNALHQANKQIVITSDRPPKEIKTLEERLRSRFEWGLIGDITPPEYETRIAILKKKAQLEGVNISDEILAFIADKIKSNIRELEGVFNRVIAYCALVNCDITIDVAKDALKDYNQKDEPRIITPDIITRASAKYFKVRPEDIMSKKRTKELAFARQTAMFLCNELTSLSLTKIGSHFNRDHTTVIHAIKRIEALAAEDGAFSAAIDELIKNIKSG